MIWSKLLCAGLLLYSPLNASVERAIQIKQQEMPSLTLYYKPSCPYSRQVLNYLNKNHKTVLLVNVQGNDRAKADLEKIGGQLRVPCLVVDNNAIYGSDDIIQWMNDNKNLMENAPY